MRDETDPFAKEAFGPHVEHLHVHAGLWSYVGGRCSRCGSISVQTLARLVREFDVAHLHEAQMHELIELLDVLTHLREQLPEVRRG